MELKEISTINGGRQCDLCVLRAKKCGKNCSGSFYKIKEKWVTCTPENTAKGDKIRLRRDVSIVYDVEYVFEKPSNAECNCAVTSSHDISSAQILAEFEIKITD